jgi:hypothetical protein
MDTYAKQAVQMMNVSSMDITVLKVKDAVISYMGYVKIVRPKVKMAEKV